MRVRNINLGLGMRTTKTAVAVMLCVATAYLIPFDFFPLFERIGEPTAFYAGAAALICMQSTIQNTVRIGMQRLISTLIGGMIGITFLFFNEHVHISVFTVLLMGLGIYVCISLCNVTKRPDCSAIACVVFLAIFITRDRSDQYIFALMRLIETAYGVIIAVAVNRFLKLPRFLRKYLDKLMGIEASDNKREPEKIINEAGAEATDDITNEENTGTRDIIGDLPDGEDQGGVR